MIEAAPSPTALRARLSRSALAAGAARALAAGARVADLRRDACGHGVALVAPVLAAAGLAAARVDDPAALAGTGLAATDADPDVSARELFGLPGSGGDPVLRLAGSVLSLKALRAGEGVSYNYTYVAAHDTRIALVSGGFGQGVVRSLGNRVRVEIGGRLHPIVGRVAMDVCVVDVGAAEAAPDDEVVYFGGTGPAQGALAEWESASGLRATELVCALGLRVPRELGAA